MNEPDISDSTFNRTTRVHDWRNHVPESVEQRWHTLSNTERLLVVEVAEYSAEREEWD